MNGLTKHAKLIPYRFKWIFMSPQERYACLWAKTKKLGELSYTDCNAEVNTNK